MTHEEALKPMDSAFWEMGEAFAGLSDDDVWVRPHHRLLSVGELAAHVAYWEARWLHPSLESPLIVAGASYYPVTLARPLAIPMGAAALYGEVKRVHEACRANVLETRPDLSGMLPGRDDWTWGYALEYTAFHMAYHTGQIYLVRHLMGHETTDN